MPPFAGFSGRLLTYFKVDSNGSIKGPFLARKHRGWFTGSGREVAGKWPESGREVAGKWPGSGREVAGMWPGKAQKDYVSLNSFCV